MVAGSVHPGSQLPGKFFARFSNQRTKLPCTLGRQKAYDGNMADGSPTGAKHWRGHGMKPLSQLSQVKSIAQAAAIRELLLQPGPCLASPACHKN